MNAEEVFAKAVRILFEENLNIELEQKIYIIVIMLVLKLIILFLQNSLKKNKKEIIISVK